MRIFRFAFVAMIFFLGTEARGGEDVETQARAAFNQGVGFYKAEQHEEALTEFQKAYSLKPNWKILYNIGQCHAVLKQYGLAIDAFEQYLAEGGDDVDTERRDTLLAELDRLRKMVGTVMLDGPDGVEVYVDGTKRVVTPVAAGILIQAGVVHEFRFVKDGEELGTKNERVRGGMSLTLKIPKPEPKPAPVPAPVVVPEEQTEEPKEKETVKETKEPEPKQEEAEETRDGLHPAFFWSGVGLTGVCAAGILAMDLAVGSKGKDIADKDQLGSIEGMQAAGIAFIALTGAAAVTTVILAFFTDFKGEDKSDEMAVGAWSTGDAGGLTLGGRF
ncbi:MAG: tetratricopeptide repeat protein [Deltaproteobacteria bacterium]|nr:tetratricopeptide repeat protein [Deltaproteobacteria bacterium]